MNIKLLKATKPTAMSHQDTWRLLILALDLRFAWTLSLEQPGSFSQAAEQANICDSMTHVFESLLERGVESLDDGDLWVPDFGTAPL